MNNNIHKSSSSSTPFNKSKKRNSSEIELSSSNNYPSFGTLSSNKQFIQPKQQHKEQHYYNNKIMMQDDDEQEDVMMTDGTTGIYHGSSSTTSYNNSQSRQSKMMYSETNENRHVDHRRHHYNKGWKLSIPVPSFYNPNHYDSFHIELHSGSGSDNDDDTGPFVKLPKRISTITTPKTIAKGTILSSNRTTVTTAALSSDDDDDHDDDDEYENKTLLSIKQKPFSSSSLSILPLTSTSSNYNPIKAAAAAWTYSAPSLTNWKLSSQSLLSITYKKSIHCIPSYTNRNICYDYIHRFMKCTKGDTSCTSNSNSSSSYRTNYYCDKSINSSSSSTKTPIFQEEYTEQDIIHIETFHNVNIMGFTGKCKAIQIHFQRPTTTINNNQNQSQNSNIPNSKSKYRFDIYNELSSTKQEERLKKKLNSHLIQYQKHTRQVPFNGEYILKDNVYGIENDYGLPLPPWDPCFHRNNTINDNRNITTTNSSNKKKRYFYNNMDRNNNNDECCNTNIRQEEEEEEEEEEKDNDDNITGDDDDDKDDENSIIYGPILTFAIPNLLDDNQMVESNSVTQNNNSNVTTKRNKIQDAAPLLWKVEFPPDPSIAIEAFTVLDGVLDVHPDEDDEEHNDDDNNRNNMAAAAGGVGGSNDGNYDDDNDSCSTCSKDDCDACHPTNIYINGYQSWSFTGSVRQGESQPTSAMPDFLSKAFNYGADVPPIANIRFNSRNETLLSSSINSTNNNDASSSNKRSPSSRSPKKNCSQSLRLENYDEDYFPYHEATHYKSDFYTCVSSVNIEESHYRDEESVKNGVSHRSLFHQNSETKLDEMGGPALVLGFLSQRKQFGLITFDAELERVAMHASLQGVVASRSGGLSTDWAYCQILPSYVYDEEPMVYYLTAVSSYNNAKPLSTHPPLTGWCSWYHYYENIDLVTLNENFKKMSNLKETITQDLAIVDDGYITAWGDWTSLKPKEFPEEAGGMKDVADNIRMNKMMPGLWMAPFACDKHSQVAKDHPDWIIRNHEGRIANSANCGKFFYGLDATNPEVREFAFNSVRRAVQEWGYKCLKLDFLYAACLDGNGKYDLSMSRAETMYLALQTLRAAAGPDTFLIGCGCPLGPAIGYMDSMRISADTGPTWYPDFPLPWWDNATLPSLRAMIRNSTTRACLGHRWWHNDPDCVLLGETTSLSDNEVISAASIVAMTGGMLLLSDDLSQLTHERISVATRIFPVTGVTAVVLDLHSTSVSGIPSLLRLWCTDAIISETTSLSTSAIEMASKNARNTAFSPSQPWKNPMSRERNLIPVAKGLGTWSICSLSNWLDYENIVSVPILSLLPPSSVSTTDDFDKFNLGYHVFAFWSSKYIWVSNDKFNAQKTISKRLGPRETEIFHVKPVSAVVPQYIGSELHFTCGYEVKSILTGTNSIDLQLKNDSKRSGFVYLYIPTFNRNINVTMNGQKGRAEFIATTPHMYGVNNASIGGHVIRVFVVLSGNSNDGRITCEF